MRMIRLLGMLVLAGLVMPAAPDGRRIGKLTASPVAEAVAVAAATADPILAMPGDGPYLHTDGGLIRDSAGTQVRLSGVNWFGLETCAFAPDGLGVRSWWDWLDQVRALGYNAIRLPFSDQILDPAVHPLYINYDLNPDLRGLSSLQVMDRIIQGAGERGLRVIIDRHRPDCTAQSPLWYTRTVPERKWIADLVRLTRRYRRQPAVIGVDLDNEPQQQATWGDGNPRTDWRLAAERAGNAVLHANPHLLIFVQGISVYHGDYYWWGGNLKGAGAAPVRLAVPHRLVYEAHDYGPSLYLQGWFTAHDFPRNLPAVWHDHWAYLQEQGIAPVLLGEFGGRTVAPNATVPKAVHARKNPTVADGIWQRTLVGYLARHPQISFMYWSLTPDSQDTGGLLNYDWYTASPAKQDLLTPLEGAAIPLPHALPAPSPIRVETSDNFAPSGTQQAMDLRLINDSPKPLDLAGVEVRYWLARPPAGTATDQPAADLGDLTAPAGTLPITITSTLRTADIDWSGTGPNSVTTAVGVLKGYPYIAIRFQPGPQSNLVLAPYGGLVIMKVRIHRQDWKQFAPDTDWSYVASPAPTIAPRLTLSLAGRRLWGTTPLDPPIVKKRVVYVELLKETGKRGTG